MTARTIVHFEIPATDVKRLSTFYAKVFGWKFQRTGTPGIDYWIISTGPAGKSVSGGMYQRLSAEDRPRNFVGVPKIDPAIAAFKRAGGTEVVGKLEVPGMGWSFIGSDPEGNLIALWEPGRMTPVRQRKARRRSR